MSSHRESSMPQGETWRIAGVSIITLLLLTFVLYQQSILYLVGKWNQLEGGDYGHGYLILAISIYLIFYNRQRLRALIPCLEYRAIVAVVLASILWMMAALVGIEILQIVALLPLVLSIVWALSGSRVTRILVFPVLYIGFAIPVWFPLTPLLQELTADAVFWSIRVMEIPALRIENMIVLPSGKLSIEEACAGMRYLMAALILGSLYAYLNYVTFYSRLIIVLVSAVAAVLANILRVFIVVYLAYTTDMQHPLVSDHVTLGWYLFGGLVVVLLVLEAQLHRKWLHNPNETLDNVVREQPPCNKGKLQYISFVLIVAIFISAAPITVFWMSKPSQFDSYPVQIILPSSAGEWTATDANEDDWTPQYRGAIAHKMVYNDKNNHEIQLYLGLYAVQRQGEELINVLNRISDDKIWRIMYQKAKLYNIGGQQVLEQLLKKNDGSQRLVWYWYRVAGQNTVNKYQAKALQVLGLLKGKQQSSIVAIATKLDDEPESARKILGQFIEEMDSSIDRVIDGK
ncbi:MAG: EpsI family protein [Gammaproteobacteria bacterium]|nr:EpsI family protein [Gammaproteobacteria bacterium]